MNLEMRFVLQCDWVEAFKASESAWCSLYDPETIHGPITVLKPTIHGSITKNPYSKEFKTKQISPTRLAVEAGSFSVEFVSWTTQYRTDSYLHHFLDVSPNQERVFDV